MHFNRKLATGPNWDLDSMTAWQHDNMTAWQHDNNLRQHDRQTFMNKLVPTVSLESNSWYKQSDRIPQNKVVSIKMSAKVPAGIKDQRCRQLGSGTNNILGKSLNPFYVVDPSFELFLECVRIVVKSFVLHLGWFSIVRSF